MNHPEPNIKLNVDLTNPGQFFACCGMLELVDRLWPGAEGWFDGERFFIATEGSTQELLNTMANTDIQSSVTDEGLKRLGTLMSAAKSSLDNDALQEKEALRTRWQEETLILEAPFGLQLSWWRDENNERTPLKTWAAKQFVLEIARPLLQGVKRLADDTTSEDLLQKTEPVEGLPFYFDSHAQCQSTALDIGFSTYDLRNELETVKAIRPALELFAFIGLERFHPQPNSQTSAFTYTAWGSRLPVTIAAATVGRRLRSYDDCVYQFSLLKRTKYMKAFLPAKPLEGAIS